MAKNTFTLKGKITDSATGAGLQNALVKIVAGTTNFGKSAITNSSGNYKISGLIAEKIIVEASLAYQPKGKMLTISHHSVADIALTKF